MKEKTNLPDIIILSPDVLAEIYQEEDETIINEHDADYFIDIQKEEII